MAEYDACHPSPLFTPFGERLRAWDFLPGLKGVALSWSLCREPALPFLSVCAPFEEVHERTNVPKKFSHYLWQINYSALPPKRKRRTKPKHAYLNPVVERMEPERVLDYEPLDFDL